MSVTESVPGETGQGAATTTETTTAAAATTTETTTSPPTAPDPFFKSLKDPALRGYAEVKGYKHADPVEFSEALLKSYQNLEKLRGVPAERLLTLPENMEDAEAMKPILEKLGYAAPAEASAYGFTEIEGAEPEVAKGYAELAMKHGIPVKQAQAVFADIIAMEKQARESLMTEVAEETAAEIGRLQGEWGPKYDERIEVARRAVRQFGFTEDELKQMESNVGAAAMYKRFHQIGLSLQEGGFVEGGSKPSTVMTADGARTERDRLTQDKDFMARFLRGDAQAREKMERLNRTIAGQTASKGGV